MNTQSKFELIMAALQVNDFDIIKKYIPSVQEYHDYKGRGTISNYLLPAFIYKEYWDILRDQGYNMLSYIKHSNYPIWIFNESIVEELKTQEPEFICDYGDMELDDYTHSNENVEILLDYFPVELRFIIQGFINDLKSEEKFYKAANKL